jgi:uncharacterized protein YggE
MRKNTYPLFFLLLVTLASSAQSSSGLLEVTGTAVCEELPRDMRVTMPIAIIDSTYLKCSQDLNATLQDLKADLTAIGFEPDQVTTRNYAIAENFEYRQGQRIRSGFKGQVTVELRTEYKPALIDAFLKTAEKFQLQYTIRFLLTEEQKEELSKEAMVLAVKDARKKAGVLSEASGVRLESIEKISYLEQSMRPGPLVTVQAMTSESDQAQGNGLKLFPGAVSVSKSVLMVWNISR